MNRILIVIFLQKTFLIPSYGVDIYFAHPYIPVNQEFNQVNEGASIDSLSYWGTSIEALPSDVLGSDGQEIAQELRNVALGTDEEVVSFFQEKLTGTYTTNDDYFLNLVAKNALAKQNIFINNKDLTLKISKLSHLSSFPIQITDQSGDLKSRINSFKEITNKLAENEKNRVKFNTIKSTFIKAPISPYIITGDAGQPQYENIFPTPTLSYQPTENLDNFKISDNISQASFTWNLVGYHQFSSMSQLSNKITLSDVLDYDFDRAILQATVPWEFGLRCQNVMNVRPFIDFKSQIPIKDQIRQILNRPINIYYRDIAISKSHWFSNKGSVFGIPNFDELFPDYGLELQNFRNYAYNLAKLQNKDDIDDLKNANWNNNRRTLQESRDQSPGDTESFRMTKTQYLTYSAQKWGLQIQDINLENGIEPFQYQIKRDQIMPESINLIGQILNIPASQLQIAASNPTLFILAFSVSVEQNQYQGFIDFVVIPDKTLPQTFAKREKENELLIIYNASQEKLFDYQNLKVGLPSSIDQLNGHITHVRHGWLSEILQSRQQSWTLPQALPSSPPFNLDVQFPVFGGYDFYIVQGYGVNSEIDFRISTKVFKVHSRLSESLECKIPEVQLIDYVSKEFPSILSDKEIATLILQASERYVGPFFSFEPITLDNKEKLTDFCVTSNLHNSLGVLCNSHGDCYQRRCVCYEGYGGAFCDSITKVDNAVYFLKLLNQIDISQFSYIQQGLIGKSQLIKAYAYVLENHKNLFDLDTITETVNILTGPAFASDDFNYLTASVYLQAICRLAVESDILSNSSQNQVAIRNAVITKALPVAIGTVFKTKSGSPTAQSYGGQMLSGFAQIFGETNQEIVTSEIKTSEGDVGGSKLVAPNGYKNNDLCFILVTMNEAIAKGLYHNNEKFLAAFTYLEIYSQNGNTNNLDEGIQLQLTVYLKNRVQAGFAYQPVLIDDDGSLSNIGNLIFSLGNENSVTFNINQKGIFSVVAKSVTIFDVPVVINQGKIDAQTLEIIKQVQAVQYLPAPSAQISSQETLSVQSFAYSLCGANCNNAGTCVYNVEKNFKECKCTDSSKTNTLCLDSQKQNEYTSIVLNLAEEIVSQPSEDSMKALASITNLVHLDQNTAQTVLTDISQLNSVLKKDDLGVIIEITLNILKGIFASNSSNIFDIQSQYIQAYDTLDKISTKLGIEHVAIDNEFVFNISAVSKVYKKLNSADIISINDDPIIVGGQYRRITTFPVTNANILIPSSVLQINTQRQTVTNSEIIEFNMQSDEIYSLLIDVVALETLIVQVKQLDLNGYDLNHLAKYKNYLTLPFKRTFTDNRMVPIRFIIQNSTIEALDEQYIKIGDPSITFEFFQSGYYGVATKDNFIKYFLTKIKNGDNQETIENIENLTASDRSDYNDNADTSFLLNLVFIVLLISGII